MRCVVYKRASVLHQYLFELIFSAFLIVLFLLATSQKQSGEDISQQVVEKQLALLIDSAESGMSFQIEKQHQGFVLSDLRVEQGKVYATINGVSSLHGYPYFSRYAVRVVEKTDVFLVEVYDAR